MNQQPSEFDILSNLKANQKLRRINDKICIETRSSFRRTFSNDSRKVVYNDLQRLYSLAKTPDEFSALKHAIEVMCTTTYKNDSAWKEKATSLLKTKNLQTEPTSTIKSSTSNLDEIEVYLNKNKDKDLMRQAALDGHLEVVKYLHSVRGIEYTPEALTFAGLKGHLKVVKYLHSVGIECNEAAMVYACLGGYIEVVEYLYEVCKCEINENNSIDYASSGGHLELVKYLHEVFHLKGRLWDAAVHGHLEVVKYLHSIGAECEFSRNKFARCAMDWAAKNGHLEIVKYLHEVAGTKCTTDAIDWASEDGHLEVVKYLHSIGTGCTVDAMDYAAKNGHLEVVKYLHSIGAGCTHWAMNFASKNSHLEVVKYLHEVVGLRK